MRMLFQRTRELTLRICERCSHVCDDACRRGALRERLLLQQVWRGMA